MKKILLFLACCLGLFSVKAQYLNHSSRWSEHWQSTGNDSVNYWEWYVDLTIPSDSFVTPYTYYKIIENGIVYTHWKTGNISADTIKNYTGWGLLREDSLRFYNLRHSDNTDHAIWDFNIAAPNSIAQGTYAMGDTITNLDSVFFDGAYRKRFWVNDSAYLLEGVGGNHSLWSFLHPVDTNVLWTSVCFHQNGSVYDFQTNYACDYLSDVAEPGGEIGFSVFPNPATDELFIVSSNMAISEINIYDANGALVMRSREPAKSVAISQLSAGLYFAEVKTNMGSARRRWVKM